MPTVYLCSSSLLCFFMVGLLLHFQCVIIGSLSHPAADRPSHPILGEKFSFLISPKSKNPRTCTPAGPRWVSALSFRTARGARHPPTWLNTPARRRAHCAPAA